ncbi:uncharacterized protein LOC129222540 [Uloborus diversus]|uniref:uncharacterized protein LOC129222540 n=1 Tax=Uloborus diversus TaxID=327109 RepID=UPI00240A50F8|nr:uncharacterized protein LOC129222540 [Uloborus diversus]
MDLERTDAFLPVINLAEDVEKIALMKAALRAMTEEHERSLMSIQGGLKAANRKLEFCTQECNAVHLQLNAVETKIAEAVMVNQESEAEALKTLKENRLIKRKIIALKSDIEQQEKILNRANETIIAVNRRNKKIKVLPEVPA